ncbi:hypothetical protein AgCh_002506 [Apium graveolens]
MEYVRDRLGLEGMLVVEVKGRSGGLALMWNGPVQVNLNSMSKYHIDVEVNIDGMHLWRLTGFYGEPNRNNKRKTWELLRNLARDSNLPWCIICDMNNIVSQADKRGGAGYPQWLLDGFNEVLENTGLRDVELYGHQYTWERGRNTDAWLEIRLDRALANTDWFDSFPAAKLYNLEGSSSDHSHIFPELLNRSKDIVRKRFCFENAWLTEPLCRQIVKYSWEENGVTDICDKVKFRGVDLESWGKEITACFSRRIKECKQKLKQLRNKRDLHSLDENLFIAASTDFEEVIEYTPHLISLEQNLKLVSDVTREEVKSALFQMHPDKTPGPDGMTPAFFQKHWDILGENIFKMTRDFFTTGVILQGLNDTNIVLIPKKKNPTAVGDMRPIALCNVLIKVITKVLANRLKGLLDNIVSPTQSAFVPGRMISDNIMVSFEIMHYLKRRKFGKEGYMALKLDMSKAYDRIEWSFLQAMLRKMGFSDWWVHLVLQCVSTVSYTIVYGTQEMGPIHPNRDEHSTYLGLPNISGRNKSTMLGYLKDKVKSIVRRWDDKHVSRSGKEILIKSVAQTLPTYAMNVFLLPLDITRDIEKCLSKFWWNTDQPQKSQIKWMSWDRMSKHKTRGGLGFRNFRDFNIAMLEKQGWRFMVYPNSLASTVNKAKYFPKTDFMNSSLGHNPSFIWRSIFEAK